MVIKVGIAWPNHLAVLALCASVSWFVITRARLYEAAARTLVVLI